MPERATNIDDLNEVYAAHLPTQALSQLSDELLGVLLNASRAANDLYLLHRVAIAISNSMRKEGPSRKKSDTLENETLNAQWIATLTLMAGKIWEAWLFIEASPKEIATALAQSAEGRHLRDEVSVMFGSGSPLAIARNNHSFHYNVSKLLADQIAILRADSKAELKFSMGAGHHLTFYGYAEILSVQAITTKMFPSLKTDHERLDRFAAETIGSAKTFLLLLAEIVTGLLAHGGTPPADQIKLDRIDISQRPKLDDLMMPFLVRYTK